MTCNNNITCSAIMPSNETEKAIGKGEKRGKKKKKKKSWVWLTLNLDIASMLAFEGRASGSYLNNCSFPGDLMLKGIVNYWAERYNLSCKGNSLRFLESKICFFFFFLLLLLSSNFLMVLATINIKVGPLHSSIL